MKYFLDMEAPMGATNFLAGLDAAFDIIDASREVDATAKCTRSILFLTDGEDKSGHSAKHILDTVGKRNSDGTGRKKANIFTYSFGKEAEIKIPKKLACQNEGIWHRVEDQGNLVDNMVKTYEFYTESGADAERVRWITYGDIVTGGELLSACLPVHARQENRLYGIVCLDLNIIISLDDLKVKDEWPSFKSAMDATNMFCAYKPRNEERLQELRDESSKRSRCSACDMDSDCDDGYDDVDPEGPPPDKDADPSSVASRFGGCLLAVLASAFF
jgi:hypothetical protein